MSLDKPTPSVKKAITSAVAFLDSIKIRDLTIENIEDKTQASGKDRVVKEDKNAPIIWARFYDLETHKPYFCGRDGIKKTALKDIENERRIGYSWYGNWGLKLIEKEFAQWQLKWK